MGAAIKAGVTLAVLVEAFSVVFTLAGAHRANPMIGLVGIVVVIGLNIGCVWWGLAATASENPYGKQLLSAIVIGVVGGILIFAFSMLNLAVLFPNYLAENNDAIIAFLETQNVPEEILDAQIAATEARTPVSLAVQGLAGTFFTSLIVGAIVAIFKRKK